MRRGLAGRRLGHLALLHRRRDPGRRLGRLIRRGLGHRFSRCTLIRASSGDRLVLTARGIEETWKRVTRLAHDLDHNLVN